jgi:hypothetical protein
MTATIRAPEERACLRCGRRERWDDDRVAWRVADEVGEPYCIHAWDVTGSFSPVVEDEDSSGAGENDPA